MKQREKKVLLVALVAVAVLCVLSSYITYATMINDQRKIHDQIYVDITNLRHDIEGMRQKINQ